MFVTGYFSFSAKTYTSMYVHNVIVRMYCHDIVYASSTRASMPTLRCLVRVTPSVQRIFEVRTVFSTNTSS